MILLEEKIKNLYDIHEIDARLVDEEAILELNNALCQSQYHNPDLPHILFLGQFKAGKSSLINALYRKYVAATDIFEMTAWIARYYPSYTEFVDMIMIDGSHNYTNLNEFLQRCQTRDFSDYELINIDRVDIGLNADTKCAIIDTPGFGSKTVENENKMREALKDADYVFFIISAESLGSHKESAIRNYLQESGTPMSCIVSKCDTIETENDKKDIAEWIASNYNIKEKEIIFSSSVTGEGIKKLQKVLEHIAINNKEMRAQAQVAYQKMIYDQYKVIAIDTKTQMDNTLHLYDEFIREINDRKSNIITILPNIMVEFVRENLFVEKKDEFVKKIENAKSEDEFNTILKGTFDDEIYLAQFEQKVQNFFIKQLKSYWGMDEQRYAFTSANSSTVPTTSLSSDGLPVKNIETSISFNDLLNDSNFIESSKSIIKTAGIFSILAAISPAVSIGAALSGIGLPIAIGGIAISALGRMIKGKKTKKIIDANTLFSKYIDEIIKESCEKNFVRETEKQAELLATYFIQECEHSIFGGKSKKNYFDLFSNLNKYLNDVPKYNALPSHKETKFYN